MWVLLMEIAKWGGLSGRWSESKGNRHEIEAMQQEGKISKKFHLNIFKFRLKYIFE